jgi:hypothetical protein
MLYTPGPGLNGKARIPDRIPIVSDLADRNRNLGTPDRNQKTAVGLAKKN